MKSHINRLILYTGIIAFYTCKESVASTIIPRSYIIEYSQSDEINNHHQVIENDLTPYNDLYQVHHTYSSPIFQGMSFTLKESQLPESTTAVSYSAVDKKHPVIDTLNDHPLIKRIYPIYEVPRPQWERPNQTVTFPYSNKDTQVFDIHNKLGITGEGILIGVLDSGVDYNHPALGKGFGDNYKIKIGKNLVSGKSDEKFGITPLGEDDPFDPCLNNDAGHGTHVSGIIAGYDPEKNFTGIAPNATLGMYRIFGCEGGASEDTVIKAMLMAYEAGCKVINLSLGIESAWPEDAMSIVAERLSEEGVLVVGVAGNQGSDGIYSQNSPASGRDVVSVASIDNSFYLSDIMNINIMPNEYFPYVLSSNTASFPNGTLAQVLNNGQIPYGCNNDTSISSEQVSGKILFLQRGKCTFEEKLKKAKDVGAEAVLFYDPDVTVKTVVVAKTEKDSLPCAGIDLKLAGRIIEIFKNSTADSIEITFPKKQEVIATESAGQISAFSSTGPTYELDLKPSITGIGGEVFSTLPLHINNGWGVRSGTSMASPHVAGTLALVLNYYSKMEMNVTSKYVVEHLQNHAQIIKNLKGKIENPLIQGAGIIQPYTSITSNIHVSPAQISFNDTSSTTEYKTYNITLQNSNKYPIHVKLNNLKSQSIQSYSDYDSFIPTEPVIKNGTVFADLEFSSNKLTIPSNTSISITVKVILPDPTKIRYHYQMYGGFISVEDQSTNKKLATIPYFGVLGRMIDIPVFDKDYPYLTSKSNPDKRPSDPNISYRFDLQNKVKTKPAIVMRLLTGSANIEIKVYDTNNTYIGEMSGGPWIYNQRNKLSKENFSSVIGWDGRIISKESGKTEDGEVIGDKLVQVPDGEYYLSLRALKHFGNPDNKNDWEEWKSGPIVIET